MKCPVCKNLIKADASVCPFCRFDELNRSFVNTEDAVDWVENVVGAYRRQWEDGQRQAHNADDLFAMIIASQRREAQASEKTDIDFEYCINDNEVTITKYVSAKRDIVVPNTINGHPVVRINDRVFQGCAELKKIQLPESLVFIGNEAFKDSGVREIVFPKLVDNIPARACCGCKELTTVVVLGASIIDEDAFSDCTQLSKVAFADRLRVIKDGAFANCSLLREVYFPASLVEISEGAFVIRGGKLTSSAKWQAADWLWSDDESPWKVREPRHFFFLGDKTEFSRMTKLRLYCHSEKCVFHCKPGSDAQTYARTHKMNYTPLK